MQQNYDIVHKSLDMTEKHDLVLNWNQPGDTKYTSRLILLKCRYGMKNTVKADARQVIQILLMYVKMLMESMRLYYDNFHMSSEYRQQYDLG